LLQELEPAPAMGKNDRAFYPSQTARASHHFR
jgi:hypothetical protein